MKINEVSEILRTPEATLRFWRHKGTGPASLKVGRHVMYRRQDVETYLASLSVNGSDDLPYLAGIR